MLMAFSETRHEGMSVLEENTRYVLNTSKTHCKIGSKGCYFLAVNHVVLQNFLVTKVTPRGQLLPTHVGKCINVNCMLPFT